LDPQLDQAPQAVFEAWVADRTDSSSPRNWFSCHRCPGSGASDQGLLRRRIDAAVAAVMAVHRAAELAAAGRLDIYI
jgi:hypothetical protein